MRATIFHCPFLNVSFGSGGRKFLYSATASFSEFNESNQLFISSAVMRNQPSALVNVSCVSDECDGSGYVELTQRIFGAGLSGCGELIAILIESAGSESRR